MYYYLPNITHDMTPSTSWYYVGHPIINKLNPLNCWYDSLTYILIVLLMTSLVNLPYTSFLCSRWQSRIHILLIRSFIQRICQSLRLFLIFHNNCDVNGEGLLAPRPFPKLEDHPLSVVRSRLSSIFAATFHSWRLFPSSTTRGGTMLWWQRPT
jgi:hypothetical protein